MRTQEEKKLDTDILSIAWPMLLTLAADPIAGLVDTAFMGKLGARCGRQLDTLTHDHTSMASLDVS